jgi:type IV secretion system protein VirB9
MIRTVLSAAVLLATALSATTAPAMARDNRLATRLYKNDEVVRVDGKVNVQASIMFDDGETIENVAVGDSESWQITPNKRANLLFVKPMAASARTNMTVVTDKRTYFFDLVASPSATPIYALRFTYADAKPQVAAAPGAVTLPGVLPDAAPLAAGLDPAEQQVLSGEQPVDPAMLNFAWVKQGATRLYPSRIYDDGVATYVTWPASVPIPAILIRNEKNQEGPVNFAVRGDAIVIDGVPGTIVLRSGRNVATLAYRGARTPGVRATGLTELPRPTASSAPAVAAAPLTPQPQSE